MYASFLHHLFSKGKDKDCKLKIGGILSIVATAGYFLCSVFLCYIPRNTPPCLGGRKKADNDIESKRQESDDDTKEFDSNKKQSPATWQTYETEKGGGGGYDVGCDIFAEVKGVRWEGDRQLGGETIKS